MDKDFVNEQFFTSEIILENNRILLRPLNLEETGELIHTLTQSNDEESKTKLRLEAEALRKAPNEKKMMLAADIYQKHLEDAETASLIRKDIVAQFPGRLSARNNECSCSNSLLLISYRSDALLYAELLLP